MTRWTGIVLALPEVASDEMASRLVTYLHPIAGRPLVWHTAALLASLRPPPARVVVVAGVDLSPELFQDIAVPVQVLSPRDADGARVAEEAGLAAGERTLVIDATAHPSPAALQSLLDAPDERWLAGRHGDAAALCIAAPRLPGLLDSAEPLEATHPVLARSERIRDSGEGAVVVRDRVDLAEVTRTVRDRLLRSLMLGGVSFLLPESVLVDVDVRIGRDSIIYPGAVIEGSTTIGEETVVGPGCRIVDSWIGSGVELKGWNYISHTSIRNRAILEPYVRRGFD